jgi:hypothetical protein
MVFNNMRSVDFHSYLASQSIFLIYIHFLNINKRITLFLKTCVKTDENITQFDKLYF